MHYKGIGPERGNDVECEDAYSYALNRCLHGSENDQKEFSSMLIEWFYSGNWIEEDSNGET